MCTKMCKKTLLKLEEKQTLRFTALLQVSHMHMEKTVRRSRKDINVSPMMEALS